MQSRIESSPAGRLAISILMLAIATSAIVTASPFKLPPLHDRGMIVRFALLSETLQGWTVFTPFVPTTYRSYSARLTYSDGEVVEWHPVRFDPFLGTYRGVRWHKWMEFQFGMWGDFGSEVWPSMANWLAHTHPLHGSPPVEVELIEHQRQVDPPGSPDEQHPTVDNVYYSTRGPFT